jgi:hypothetical protein
LLSGRGTVVSTDGGVFSITCHAVTNSPSSRTRKAVPLGTGIGPGFRTPTDHVAACVCFSVLRIIRVAEKQSDQTANSFVVRVLAVVDQAAPDHANGVSAASAAPPLPDRANSLELARSGELRVNDASRLPRAGAPGMLEACHSNG